MTVSRVESIGVSVNMYSRELFVIEWTHQLLARITRLSVNWV